MLKCLYETLEQKKITKGEFLLYFFFVFSFDYYFSSKVKNNRAIFALKRMQQQQQQQPKLGTKNILRIMANITKTS